MYPSVPDQVLKLIRFSLIPSLHIHFISYGLGYGSAWLHNG